MEEVKKNISTFHNILQIGTSESVIHWDISNFKRAQKWAQYAEEVYKKLKNKPSLALTLSNYIKETEKSNQDSVGASFTFNDLQYASEKLRLVLLHNPHLSSAQFSHVLDLYQVDFSATSNEHLEEVIVDTYSISCSKGTFRMLSSMKDHLCCERTRKSCEDERGTADTCLDSCAQLMWENINKLSEKQKEICSKYDGVIKKVESMVGCSEKGMEVVLRMLVNPMKDETPMQNSGILDNDVIVLDQLKRRVLHWILECSRHTGTKNYEKIWSCRSRLLCKISVMNISFCESYLSFLHSCGDILLGIGPFNFEHGEQANCGSSYQNIIERLQLLIQGPDHVSGMCKEKLILWSAGCVEGFSATSDVSVREDKLRMNLWKKIYHEICK